MPLQATSGAASYDAFGGGVPVVPQYIEDVFSTWLYTGNGSTQTITNGIDLSGEGGAVWIKGRNAAEPHVLVDTVRGASNALRPNASDASINDAGRVSAFTTSGFTVGTDGETNGSGTTYASWTFREQAKFFDIVTWSGDSTSGRQIAHNLGSTPGMVIIKSLVVDNWCVWHRSLTAGNYIVLNSTAAQTTSGAVNRYGNGTTTVDPTSTYITVGSNGEVNQTGNNYVAYIFAHNAGGFGLTGTDNVISCGSYVGDGTTNKSKKITLGYEPQFIIMKPAQSAPSGFNGWNMLDIMRGIATGGNDPTLRADSSGAEDGTNDLYSVEADGFRHTYDGTAGNDDGITYIYIAIRRGPMKVPTSGTSVFKPVLAAGTTGTKLTTNFPVDAQIWMTISDGVRPRMVDRLRGVSTNSTSYGVSLFTSSTDAQDSTDQSTLAFDNTGFAIPGNFLGSGINAIYWNFKRAPSFFDEVCYTGNGSTQTITHNLTAVPELMLIKQRSGTNGWPVYSSGTGNTKFAYLNQTSAFDTNSSAWNNTSPTSSVFTVGSGSLMNTNAQTYVAYLFATCAGVSKVGSYTGTGTTLQIDCGFTGGARFVLIKKTSGTGSWYVWDSARGIVSGNDPYLLLNSTAAEVTNTDYIDTYSAGFEISSTAPSEINENGGSFIFLAIA